MALYDEIGGAGAVDAESAQLRARHPVDGRAFLTMAFGGPNEYEGRDLRAAHRRAVGQGLNDALFEVFMGHFRATLDELSVPPPKIAEIVKIAEGGRNDVLNR